MVKVWPTATMPSAVARSTMLSSVLVATKLPRP
jgi:hypothetical protein